MSGLAVGVIESFSATTFQLSHDAIDQSGKTEVKQGNCDLRLGEPAQHKKNERNGKVFMVFMNEKFG